MTHKIAKIWNRVSYETMIFIAFLIRFLSTRALDLDTWSSAWDAMDYSMGNGSRLLEVYINSFMEIIWMSLWHINM